MRFWWLSIKLSCTHCPTPQTHNHVEPKQSTIISMADIGGSSSSGCAAADDLGSGQQGGSSADSEVDTIDLLGDADEEVGPRLSCRCRILSNAQHLSDEGRAQGRCENPQEGGVEQPDPARMMMLLHSSLGICSRAPCPTSRTSACSSTCAARPYSPKM